MTTLMGQGSTLLDQILDLVAYGQREVTIDAEEYTPGQVKRVATAARARGLDVSGTNRWLLVRDLRGQCHEP